MYGHTGLLAILRPATPRDAAAPEERGGGGGGTVTQAPTAVYSSVAVATLGDSSCVLCRDGKATSAYKSSHLQPLITCKMPTHFWKCS